MNLKKYMLFTAVIILLFSCTTRNQNQQITNVADYQPFLEIENNKSLLFAEAEKSFWKDKYNASPNQVSYLTPLAASHTMLFEYTGNIKNLKTSEKYLLEANQKTAYKKAGLLRALAKNYITQHRFKEALKLLEKALVLGEKKNATQKILFDVYLELGQDINAEKKLLAIKDFNDFDYLIRLSKWQDHKGDLDAAIKYMEQAKNKVEALNNKQLMLWSYSNLADFYGHAGQIEASYQHYLKVLAIDPNYTYALRRIAWIIFSHEKNTREAAMIINTIALSHNTPDLHLFKSKLAEFNNDPEAKKTYLKQYFKMIENKNYGEMYNSYNTVLYAENDADINLALNIAKREIENRPTTKSYDLLAWVYHKKGNTKKALQIVVNHVAGKTSEPTVLYHMAKIYKANNMKQKVSGIKKELLNSLYELGPNMASNIHNL
jgi:tetratricopeptide (TPR) repeat protein